MALCGLLSLGTAHAGTTTTCNIKKTDTIHKVEETTTIRKVIDGDTVLLEDGRKVRYRGINSPEKGDPHAEEATDVNNVLVSGKTVRLEYEVEKGKAKRGDYGRLLAYAFVGDTLVNAELVRLGYAYLYRPVRGDYSEKFLQARNEARSAGRGLWAQDTDWKLAVVKVHADPEGLDRENKNKHDEYIVIENQGQTLLEMTGWTVSDASQRDPYLFPLFTLPPKAQVTLHTGYGKNTERTLFWGTRKWIWNNDGDTIAIRDAEGRLVLSCIYGDKNGPCR